jgi:hypothetical protein
LEFSPGAHGSNVTPTNTIYGFDLFNVLAVATDSSENVYALTDPVSGPVEIAEYASGSSGSGAPTRVIVGAHTGFQRPEGIAIDNEGDIYVADYLAASVKEFTPSQHGNVYPHAVIQGALTELSGPYALAIDDGDNIYVTDDNNNAMYEFAAGASGNVMPIRTITNGIMYPWSIALCQDVPPCELGDSAARRNVKVNKT